MYEFRGFLEKPIIQISNVTITCWKGLLQQMAQRKGKSYYLLISLNSWLRLKLIPKNSS